MPVIVVTAKELTAEDIRVLSGQTERIIAKDEAYLDRTSCRRARALRTSPSVAARRRLKNENTAGETMAKDSVG